MTKFRTYIFLYLISLSGLLWSTFLAWYAGYFLEGVMISGLIVVTNLFVIMMHFRR